MINSNQNDEILVCEEYLLQIKGRQLNELAKQFDKEIEVFNDNFDDCEGFLLTLPDGTPFEISRYPSKQKTDELNVLIQPAQENYQHLFENIVAFLELREHEVTSYVDEYAKSLDFWKKLIKNYREQKSD